MNLLGNDQFFIQHTVVVGGDQLVYPFVWLDAIHYKVKQDGRYAAKAVYTVQGLNLEGRKEILGLYLSETVPIGHFANALPVSEARTSGCRC